MNAIFEVDRLNKTYKKGTIKANDNIDFHVNRGEILGLLGPNGAGKSTLIKQMVGQLKPCSGEIRFNGMNVLKQTQEVAREVAYYAQEPHSLTTLKVKEVLYFTGMLRGLSRSNAQQQMKMLIEMFEMAEFSEKQMKQLSGGQKRLIGIGTALIGNCPVLIFDEPTNELDPVKRRLVWNAIRQRNKEGATIILVTHNVLEAEQVVNRVAVINHGKLLAIDHVSRMKQKVDRRLKLEVVVDPAFLHQIGASLERFGHVQRISEHRMCLLLGKSMVGKVMDIIVTEENYPIEEFYLVPPSLEDVYFHIAQETSPWTEVKGT
jgi:ABC-2 type transport system ATP-binding protein